MAKKTNGKTPEERAAEEAYQRALDRRLRETIERYRALNAAKCARPKVADRLGARVRRRSGR